MGDTPLLSVQNVTLSYNTPTKHVTAAYDISFDVPKGERVCILGKSGCGKSTVLSGIGGYKKPEQGHILLEGQPVIKPSIKSIFIFQGFTQILPWLSVLSNVLFALQHGKKMSKEDAKMKARYYLNMVGLSDRMDKYPHELSGGQKQRVAIARGMAMEPELLLLDEPFSALDALTKNHLQDELLNLAKRNSMTLVMVTHDINEAIKIGTRIVCLSAHPGQVVAELNGLPEDASAEQKNALADRIRGYIGANKTSSEEGEE